MRIAFAIFFFISVAHAESPRDYIASQQLLQVVTWPQSCQRFSVRLLSVGENTFGRAVSGLCPHLYVDKYSVESELPLQTFGDVKSELRRMGRDIAISWLENQLNTHLGKGWNYATRQISYASRGKIIPGDLPRIKPKAYLGHKGIALSIEINF